jgi:uncharacterized protein YgfB (UPF0149 family)
MSDSNDIIKLPKPDSKKSFNDLRQESINAFAIWADKELARLGIEKSIRDKISGPIGKYVEDVRENAFHLGLETGSREERKTMLELLKRN